MVPAARFDWKLHVRLSRNGRVRAADPSVARVVGGCAPDFIVADRYCGQAVTPVSGSGVSVPGVRR